MDRDQLDLPDRSILLPSGRDETRRCNDFQLEDEMTTSMKRLHVVGVVERCFHVP
jgi:hypothetical protein